MHPTLCAVLHPFLFRHFSPLVSRFFYPSPPWPLPYHCFFPVLFVWFVGCLALCVGAALRVSLKLCPSVLNALSIFSAPSLPPTIHCRSFLVSPRNVLLMPPFASVSDQHAIGFLSTVVILIICFPCFSFGCFSRFCLYLLFFHFILFVPFIWLFFHFCPFIFLYVFSFLFFLLVIRLYPLKLVYARDYICIWFKPLGCGCELYPSFQVEEDKY